MRQSVCTYVKHNPASLDAQICQKLIKICTGERICCKCIKFWRVKYEHKFYESNTLVPLSLPQWAAQEINGLVFACQPLRPPFSMCCMLYHNLCCHTHCIPCCNTKSLPIFSDYYLQIRNKTLKKMH